MQLFATIVLTGLIGAVVLPAPAGAAVPGTSDVTVPTSIPSDCSRDVSADLTAWIASVPDGSTLQFAPGGCYRADRTIAIQYRNNLTFEGNESTFRAFTNGRELGARKARNRSMFSFWQGTNITMRNTIVRGANPNAGLSDAAYVPALEAQTAYVVGGVENMVLDHVEAYDVYGDFVFVGAATHNLLVKSSTFARNGRQGWTINGTDIVFENNNIRMTRRATIDLEPSSVASIARRITIRNNTIGAGRLYFFANGGFAAPTEDISIIGNTFLNKAMTVRVNPPNGTRSRYRIIGNRSTTPMDGAAFALNNVLGVEIRDNVQPMQRGTRSPGVSIRDCHDVTVTGNQFRFGGNPVRSRGGNVNVTQSGNSVGNPLQPAASTQSAGPA
jgi:Right handed beta helix region